MKVRWSPLASQRLIEIEEYIAEDSPEAAERFVEKLVEKGNSLPEHPDRGRLLPELHGSQYRELVIDNYRLIYRVGGRHIDILTVFDGHRLLRLDEI